MVTKCEKCLVLHPGTYGSGRFCCAVCARSYSSLLHRARVNEQVSETLRNAHRSSPKKGKVFVKREERTCGTCAAVMTTLITSTRRFCSPSCAAKSVAARIGSQRLLKAYRDGRKVSGGRTRWLPYKDIKVQGTYELRTCRILDCWVARGSIVSWSYSTERFQYFDLEGVSRTYIPDFVVCQSENLKFYLETKGRVVPLDELKWASMRSRGLSLVVWLESDIAKEEGLLGFESV